MISLDARLILEPSVHVERVYFSDRFFDSPLPASRLSGHCEDEFIVHLQRLSLTWTVVSRMTDVGPETLAEREADGGCPDGLCSTDDQTSKARILVGPEGDGIDVRQSGGHDAKRRGKMLKREDGVRGG